MKILIVASFFPYPPHFGGAFDVLERIKGIKSLGHDIDLVCTCKEFPEEKNVVFLKQFINELIIVPRKNKIINLFSAKPLQVISRKSLKKVALKKNYDYAILEAESVGIILENKYLKASQIVVRVHNNESDYFFQLAKSTKKYIEKLYYYLEGIKYKKYSKAIFEKADRLWFISNEEIKNCHILFRNKSIYLPASVNEVFVKQELSNKTVLFIGALFMPNNLEAIMWYLQNVHFLITEKNYKLIIAGSTGDKEPIIFEDIFKKYSNVEVLLNRSDLSSYYSQSTIFINPMLHGAGVKIKSINAIQNGLILISSKIGAEGTGLVKNEMYLEADLPEDFINAILKTFTMNIDTRQKMVDNAQDFLTQNNYLSVLKKEIQDEN
ncbi:glycosyltransferase family 4 protein [Flavobacterium sp. SORGH_AS_0622]|uniref:glycosyltransferase family 4 protein n=1 Tax=Flavobacterium sp. SORGH_AS_0622 TaxID=3041772 RepID=UPI002787F175|nr:glycosyltransferase family 4 protein [Flavobacterium sp. SORGH_AS_0622]MDQ1168098.1 glycosyltransferase involved in cell wall biosynthesis [Flavobacterium sp. SORGH_AS_0622]